jgi:hypothetical protein
VSTEVALILAAAWATLLTYIVCQWRELRDSWWRVRVLLAIRDSKIFPTQRVPTDVLLRWWDEFCDPDWIQALDEQEDREMVRTMRILERETFQELKSRKAI